MSSSETSKRSIKSNQKNILPNSSNATLSRLNEEISQLSNILSNLARENSEKRKNISLLERQLESITDAVSQNIDIVKDVTDQMEAENNELVEACQLQQDLLNEISTKYRICVEKGIDFSQYPEFELEELQDFLPEEAQIEGDSLAFIRQIGMKIPYFSDCNSVESFLDRCSELMREVKKVTNAKLYRSAPSKFRPDEKLLKMTLPELKEKLHKMELKYSMKYSKYSRQLADLNNQKHFYEKKYDEFLALDRKQNSYFSPSGTTVAPFSPFDDLSVVEPISSPDDTEISDIQTPRKNSGRMQPLSPIIFERASPVHSLIDDW